MKRIISRNIGFSIGIFLGLFLTFVAISFSVYPGGNNFDPLARGHSFWLNFWCDILANETLNGVPNAARPYAILAGLSLISGLLILGINSERLIPITKNKFRLMLGLGILSIVTALE